MKTFKQFYIPTIEDLKPFAATEECYEVVAQVAKKFPSLKVDSGFFVKKNGEAGDHAWLVALDGTIIDPTYGQFNKRIPILIAKPNSPIQKRYHSWNTHHDPECLCRKLRTKQSCQVCDYIGSDYDI